MPPGKQDLELYPKLWTVMTLLLGKEAVFRAPQDTVAARPLPPPNSV